MMFHRSYIENKVFSSKVKLNINHITILRNQHYFSQYMKHTPWGTKISSVFANISYSISLKSKRRSETI